MAKKFLLLGSCRVVNTIAYNIGDNILLNKKDLWFTHYLDEHIQKIKHLFKLSSIEYKYRELFVRYEQESHYNLTMDVGVGDSIKNGIVELQNDSFSGTLNVIVELPTTRYVKVSMGDKIMWGHMINLDFIRNSRFSQEGIGVR